MVDGEMVKRNIRRENQWSNTASWRYMHMADRNAMLPVDTAALYPIVMKLVVLLPVYQVQACMTRLIERPGIVAAAGSWPSD